MGVAWGDALEPMRVAELLRLEQQWLALPSGRPSPFAGKTLTGADVFWVAAHVLAGSASDHDAAEHRLRMAQTDALLRVSLDLSALNLRGAILSAAALQQAVLGRAHLEDATLGVAQLQGAYLGGTQLQGAFLDHAQLTGAVLNGARLDHASLYAAHLQDASLKGAILDDAILTRAVLDGANVSTAHLVRADLTRASLVGTILSEADLTSAILYEAQLERAIMRNTQLIGADLRRASCDANTRLNDIHLHRAALYQTSFDRTNLTVITWSEVRILGDELRAMHPREAEVSYTIDGTRVIKHGQRKSAQLRMEEYVAAARAYRSLSVELQTQGVVRDATRFHFRAEVMNRHVAWQRAMRRMRSPWVLLAPLLFIPWLLSLILSIVAGYGVYHVWRLAVTYVAVVAVFAGAYFLAGQHAHPNLSGVDALVLSLTSFHGRGLQPSSSLTDTMREIAGVEAILGLLLEGLFIAAFTRRVTGG